MTKKIINRIYLFNVILLFTSTHISPMNKVTTTSETPLIKTIELCLSRQAVESIKDNLIGSVHDNLETNRNAIEIIEKNPEQIHITKRYKETPLHIAAQKCLESVVIALITGKADPNAKDKWGQTPLSRALNPKLNPINNNVVKSLLRAKSDPNDISICEEQALELIISKFFRSEHLSEQVLLLLEYDADPTVSTWERDIDGNHLSLDYVANFWKRPDIAAIIQKAQGKKQKKKTKNNISEEHSDPPKSNHRYMPLTAPFAYKRVTACSKDTTQTKKTQTVSL